MSAIRMTCPKCKGTYIAGMVGTTMWPPHVCPEWPQDHPSRTLSSDEAAERARASQKERPHG